MSAYFRRDRIVAACDRVLTSITEGRKERREQAVQRRMKLWTGRFWARRNFTREEAEDLEPEKAFKHLWKLHEDEVRVIRTYALACEATMLPLTVDEFSNIHDFWDE